MNIDAAITSILMIFLVAAFFGPWRDLCTAYARQIVFEKRDAIFDMAREGKLDFNSVEYRRIRRSLELTIRFAHELSAGRYWILASVVRSGEKKSSALMDAVDGIQDQNVRNEVKKLISDSYFAMMLMMYAKSPLTVLFVFIYIILIKCVSGMRGIGRGLIFKSGEKIQMEAEHAPVYYLGRRGSVA